MTDSTCRMRPSFVLLLLTIFIGVNFSQNTYAMFLDDSQVVRSRDEKCDKLRKGVVRIKAQLKADGTVGSVEDVTKKNRECNEKKGWSQQALEAAKRIKFVPKKNRRISS